MVYFRQIRKSGDTGDLIKELAEAFNRAQAESGIDDLGTQLRLQLLDTDSMGYAEVDGPNVLNGDKTDTDSIGLTDSDGPNTLQTSKAFQYTLSESSDGAGVTQPGLYDFSDYSTDETS